MRFSGRLTSWNAERGFGFIEIDGSGQAIWFALAYLVMSAVCLLAYAFDKSAAVAGRWRSSERYLLGLGVLGGWPGALMAQHMLRHKSSKASFRGKFWATVALNVAAFVGYHVLVRPSLFA